MKWEIIAFIPNAILFSILLGLIVVLVISSSPSVVPHNYNVVINETVSISDKVNSAPNNGYFHGHICQWVCQTWQFNS